jgi:radical SAM protein with 4Fe4S-binding SPASM domain
MTINKTELIPFPRALRIEPASQCNLACSHCPTGNVDMDRGIMGESLFEKVLSELLVNKDYIKVIVLYHGGEPLLNSNFYRMVARIKEINNRIIIKTVSNGMALTQKHSEDLLSSGIDSIEFSLDGVSPEESQYVRVNSNTHRIIQNIKRLLELKKSRNAAKPEIYIATTQFLRDKNSTDLPGVPETPAWLEHLFGGEVSGYNTTYALRWPHMGNSGKFDFFKPSSSADCDVCDHVNNTLTIRSDGAVVPCCYDLTSQLVMGNILKESLTDIWNGQMYSLLRESIKSKNYISICKTCAVVRPPVYLIPKWNADLVLQIDKSST